LSWMEEENEMWPSICRVHLPKRCGNLMGKCEKQRQRWTASALLVNSRCKSVCLPVSVCLSVCIALSSF
jgi:hypothetical protein